MSPASAERFSVTEVRNALRCPRIFALGRARGSAVAFPVGSSCLGASFHRIVERFTREVSAPPPYFSALEASARRDDVEAGLARWLGDHLVHELESDPGYASIPGEVDELAEALRELSRHVAGRLERAAAAQPTGSPRPSPAQAIEQTLHSGERPVEAAIEGTSAVVHGRVDALFADAHRHLEVVEYKLTDEANDALDRAQVALYRHLLKLAEDVDARAVVLRFLPTLRETTLSDADADALLERTLRPLIRDMTRWAQSPETTPATERRDLCAACPVATACHETFPDRFAPRDDPPAPGVRPDAMGAITRPPPPPPRPDDGDQEGLVEAERLQARILAELKKAGIAAVSPAAPVVGPTLYVIEVSRPRGSVVQLDRAAQDVAHRLAAEAAVEYERDGGHRRFVVKRAKPRRVVLTPLLQQRAEWLAQKPGRFVLGQRPDGQIVCGDFADSSTPHLLIAGQAGSGKSVLLQALVASLVHFHGPESIRFTLIDPKRVTFNVASFQSAIAAHLDGPIRFDAEETLPILDQLVEVMERRYRAFEAARVQDLDEYNEQVPAKSRLERRIVVIDEFQDLTAEKSVVEPFFGAVKRLGAKARAAGIHLVLATQRPDRTTVPPIVKANLGGKIALRVASAVNSRIVLDVPGAEKLLGKGDLLADLGHGLVRAQGALIG